ncbi:hypothetical protein D3C72_2573980 [compost metagenome]
MALAGLQDGRARLEIVLPAVGLFLLAVLDEDGLILQSPQAVQQVHRAHLPLL